MNLPEVRVARPEDDAAIGELLVDAFTSAYARKMPWIVYDEPRKAQLRAVAEKRRHAMVWAAELGGVIVGTVSLYPPGAEGSEAWLPNASDLRHLATAPAVHGRGYSTALLTAAEREARQRGDAAICLHVRRGAEGVGRLYLRHGFVREPAGDLDKPNVFLEGYVRHLET